VTRSNDPAPFHGWQATPGHPIPRAARQPAANGLLLVMVLLVWFSPLSIVAWLIGQAVILLQRRWHWWRFTFASLAGIGLVLAVTGPQEALRRHVFVPQHFWQYVALHFGFGPPGTRITIGQFLWDLVATQVWLAVPVGLLAASLSVLPLIMSTPTRVLASRIRRRTVMPSMSGMRTSRSTTSGWNFSSLDSPSRPPRAQMTS